MSDGALAKRVKQYLESKFVRNAFSSYTAHEGKGPLYFAIRGIKAKLWYKVVKPELERLAADYDHALIMHVEKPTNKFLEFEFTALRASLPPPPIGEEPPLTSDEIRLLRAHLRRWGNRSPYA